MSPRKWAAPASRCPNSGTDATCSKQVRAEPNSPFELVFAEGKNPQALPLKLATPQELQQITSAFGIDVSEGLSIKWPPDTPNQRPVGLYRGLDRAGKEVIVAFFFFFDNGYATRSRCK
jgi:hypothetical protein